MEPPNKLQKKQTKVQILADEITTRFCDQIDSGVYSYGGVYTTFEFASELKKLKNVNIIKIINHVQKSQTINNLVISYSYLNNDCIKYLFAQLITNISVNSLILIFNNINFDFQNYFDEFKTLLSIPNKITSLSLKKSNYDNDTEYEDFPVVQLIDIIQSSNLVNLELELNNLTLCKHIEILKVLPKSLKVLKISLLNEKRNFVVNKTDISNELVLEFANAIQKTNLESITINFHLFTFLQSCIIANKLPKTLTTFIYSIRNNNFAVKDLYKDMRNFSELIYNNFNLTTCHIDYGYEYSPESQLIPYYNLEQIFINNNPLYNKIHNLIKFHKLVIQKRSLLSTSRNRVIPFDRESILNMVLSVNKVNKEDTNSTQFSYLPIEILNLVNTFVYHKSISEIKKKELITLYDHYQRTRNHSLEVQKKRYDESNECADKLVKRKLFERATELRNSATETYNSKLQQIQEIYNNGVRYLNEIDSIFKGSY
jgi:hypothetical protein